MRHASLIAAFALAGCAAAPSAPSPDLLRRIESARTPADHQALVEHYSKEARADAKRHRRMARGPFAGRGNWTLPAHCRSLAAQYAALAAEYDGIIIAHRQLAALSAGAAQRP